MAKKKTLLTDTPVPVIDNNKVDEMDKPTVESIYQPLEECLSFAFKQLLAKAFYVSPKIVNCMIKSMNEVYIHNPLLLKQEVEVLTTVLEDILKSEDIFFGLSSIVSDELIIRLPSEFKKQLSTVYNNRPLIVKTITNALQVVYDDCKLVSSNDIKQYSTLLTGLTTENVEQLEEQVDSKETISVKIRERIGHSIFDDKELLNYPLTTSKDNSDRPITTMNEKGKYNTISIDNDVLDGIKDTMSRISKDCKDVKPTNLLKVKNWLYRTFTPIQKQVSDLREVMSHQSKDSVLSREQYYSTIQYGIRTKFRQDATLRVLSERNPNLRSLLDLIGDDHIPLKVKKRWFK